MIRTSWIAALTVVASAGIATADPQAAPPPDDSRDPTVPTLPIPPPSTTGPLGAPPADKPPPPPTNAPPPPPADKQVPLAGSGANAGSGSGSAGSGADTGSDRPTGDRTAVDTMGAPRSGDDSGRTDVVDPGPSALRTVGRGVLFVPKILYEIAFLPVVAVFYGLDRYHLDDLYYRIFFNANHTIGLLPTATYVSGVGLAVGLRFQMDDIFHEGEAFAVQGTTGAVLGDSYREGAQLELHSGRRLGRHVQLGLILDFDRRPEDAFFGIGNGNQRTTPPPAPIDPRTDSYSYEVFNRYREQRISLSGDVHPTDELHIIFTGELTDLRFSPASADYGTLPLPTVYNPADLPGFVGGVEHAYGELEIRWDTRHRGTMWEPYKLYSGGSLASLYAGRVARLDGGVDFWRYGGEVQHFFRLARGPRALSVRLRAAGVTGSIDDVPFAELTELGGGDFLRGYSYNRFLDRASVLGSVQYTWDLSYFVGAYIFTDVGRVYDSFDDLTPRGMRLGYGIGLDLHGETGLVVTTSIASSIDGGIVLTFAFNSAVDARTRWR